MAERPTKGLVKRLARLPFVGRAGMIAYRAAAGSRLVARPVGQFARWLVRSKEYTNYTYDLTPLNIQHLAALVSHVTGAPVERIYEYIDELTGDNQLQDHIRSAVLNSEQGRFADTRARFGRRIGWYVLVRALRPKLVVETGVDKGLGACVVCAALARNVAEGHAGRYVGTDINPDAGYLLTGRYAEMGRVSYGDSIETLRALEGPVDIFINDSDHSADYERREYDVIASKLSQKAVIIGDNAHETSELFDFANRTGRSFLFFKEEPKNHWYPGAGLGVAWDARE